MDAQRKHWNEQQKELRAALQRPGEYDRAIDLFLMQHAKVHASAMPPDSPANHSQVLYDRDTFEDGLWTGLDEAGIRSIPPKEEHSLAWIIWHLARIEDVTMNVLVAGSLQVFHQGGWREKLKVSQEDTGNLLDADTVAALSATVDIDQLRQYRMAVGRSTRQVVQALTPADLKRKTPPDRLEELLRSGAVLPAAQDLLTYWGSLTVVGLLLMPPTRHNFIHLNEAWNLVHKLLKSR